jgi:hypothetical protein
MPLVRRAPAPPPPEIDVTAAIRLLASAEPELRRQAVRVLGEVPANTPQAREAAVILAQHLPGETATDVREAVFLAFTLLGGTETAALVGSFLRAEDAALRNGAVETLKRLGDAAIGTVDRLLSDPDPDVRLLSVEVMRNWPAREACPRLQRLLTEEAHINVCGVALDITMAAGDASLLPALDLCRKRFAGQFFVQFAIDSAMRALAPPPPPAEPAEILSIAPPLPQTTSAAPAAKPRPAGRRRAKVPGA